MKSAVYSARSELDSAVAEFIEHYEMFANKNRCFDRMEAYVDTAILEAGNEGDMRNSARVFGNKLKETMRMMEKKRQSLRNTWTGKLESFLTTLYPVARLALRLTSVVSGVISLHRHSNL